MRRSITLVSTVGLVAAIGCRTATPTSDAPSSTPSPSPAAAPSPAPAAATAPAADPDARFMQEMIGHHGQALVMAALIPARTSRQDLRSLGERIIVSQRDEIAAMQQWLRDHGHAAPAAATDHGAHGAQGAHGAGGHEGHTMPGMLTQAELDRLAASTGVAFERLFLEYMIRHHEGAIAMVRQLLATGARRSDVYHLANEIQSDQQMEIDRMRRLLAALGGPSGS